MSTAIDLDILIKKLGPDANIRDHLKYFSNVVMRVRRSAYIEGAYQICETLSKGDRLILSNERESKIDQWDVAVSVERNGKIMKLGYLDRNFARTINVNEYTAEVFEPFNMSDNRFSNSGLRILIKLK